MRVEYDGTDPNLRERSRHYNDTLDVVSRLNPNVPPTLSAIRALNDLASSYHAFRREIIRCDEPWLHRNTNRLNEALREMNRVRGRFGLDPLGIEPLPEAVRLAFPPALRQANELPWLQWGWSLLGSPSIGDLALYGMAAVTLLAGGGAAYAAAWRIAGFFGSQRVLAGAAQGAVALGVTRSRFPF